MKMVLVVWEDASDVDEGTWIDRATAPEPTAVIFHQIGFIERFTASELVLYHVVGEHHTSIRARIPTGMIREIHELKAEPTPMSIPKRRKPRKK